MIDAVFVQTDSWSSLRRGASPSTNEVFVEDFESHRLHFGSTRLAERYKRSDEARTVKTDMTREATRCGASPTPTRLWDSRGEGFQHLILELDHIGWVTTPDEQVLVRYLLMFNGREELCELGCCDFETFSHNSLREKEKDKRITDEG